jgi:hypothetical protein
MLRNWIRRLITFLEGCVLPYEDELVMKLIMGAHGCELSRDEWVEFAPVPGTCGNIKMSGNSILLFEYLMFHKPIMNFIHVQCLVKKPDKFEWTVTVVKSPDLHENGQVLECTDAFKSPFYTLAKHLYRYFPITKPHGIRGLRKEVLNGFEAQTVIQNCTVVS